MSIIIFIVILNQQAISGGFSYSANKTLVGAIRHHVVAPKETLLDIARKFDLGYLEITGLYPDMDPPCLRL